MAYYHIRITQASAPSYDETRLDMTFEELDERFLSPYREGSKIVINGKVIPVSDVERIRISKSDQDSNYLRPIAERERRTSGVISFVHSGDWDIANQGEDVTDELITDPPGSAVESVSNSNQDIRPSVGTREVFVVHGRNTAARDAVFHFLRAIDLSPLEWSVAVQSTGKSSPYVGEILDAAFSRAHAVLVLFTPDDEARLREAFRYPGEAAHETELTGQARPNVLFEAGMAIGRSEDRTVLVEIGLLRPFSDIAGRHVIRIDNSTQRRQDLAQRLGLAGCPIKLDGTDWHTAGDFESAVNNLSPDSNSQTEDTKEEIAIEPGLTLSEDEATLLLQAANDPDGTILKFKTMGVTIIRVNDEVMGDPEDRRSIARWESAIRGLLDRGFIEDPNGNDKSYQITHEGFAAVDALRQSSDTGIS